MFNTKDFLIKKLENDLLSGNISRLSYDNALDTLKKYQKGASMEFYLDKLQHCQLR